MQHFSSLTLVLAISLPFFFHAQPLFAKKKDKVNVVAKQILTPDPYMEMRLDKPLNNSPLSTSATRTPVNTLTEGIDVSHYQGRINWAAVAQSGQVGYAYIKASESVSFIDENYQYNLTEARKYGINVGSYHFYRAHVDQEAQLRHMFSIINPAQQDLIPVVDVETANGVPVETFANRLHRFLKAVEEHYGRPPILYTYVNFYNTYLAHRGFNHYPLFIAFYQDRIPSVSDGNSYFIWQYTSKGHINGIRGNVDRSKFMNGHTIHDILYP